MCQLETSTNAIIIFKHAAGEQNLPDFKYVVAETVCVCHLFENNTTMAALILLLADLIPAWYSISQY